MTIKELIELLKTVPQDMVWQAYEGEDSGFRIDSNGKPWGFVHDGTSPFKHRMPNGVAGLEKELVS